MKTKVKRLVLSAVAVLALVAFFQVETSQAGIVIPVAGCKFTGDPNDSCRVGDYLEITSCKTDAGGSNCGIEVEIPN